MALTLSLTFHLHEVTSGPALVFQPRAQLASGSEWMKALHQRKKEVAHVESLFYMKLNGSTFMHACVNVRFLPLLPPLAPTRVTTPHTPHTPGDRISTHTCAHITGALPAPLRWQTAAEASAPATMEGCGVLFYPWGGQWWRVGVGEAFQRRTSWFDTCDEADD